MSEEKNKTQLEKLIHIEAVKRYENDLQNLAVAFVKNGFGNIAVKPSKSFCATKINECLEYHGNQLKFCTDFRSLGEGKKTFEKIMKELIPEFDQYKQQNIEKHVDEITASIFNNLNDIKQLFEERN